MPEITSLSPQVFSAEVLTPTILIDISVNIKSKADFS